MGSGDADADDQGKGHRGSFAKQGHASARARPCLQEPFLTWKLGNSWMSWMHSWMSWASWEPRKNTFHVHVRRSTEGCHPTQCVKTPLSTSCAVHATRPNGLYLRPLLWTKVRLDRFNS